MRKSYKKVNGLKKSLVVMSLAAMLSLCSCGSVADELVSSTEETTRRQEKAEVENDEEKIVDEETETTSEEIVTTEEQTTEEKKAEATIDENGFNESEYRTDITFDSLLRKPDDYENMKMKISGVVNSIYSEGDVSYFQILKDTESLDFYVVAYDPDVLGFRILENDEVEVWGIFTGLGKFEMLTGQTKEEPTFVANKVEVPSYDEMATSASGELRTGNFTSSETSGEIPIDKYAEITYQDGEAYAITLYASAPNAKELGNVFCFLTDEGNGKYTGQVEDIGSITIMAYEDHFTVSYKCNSEDYEYRFSGIDGEYYY